MLMYLWYHSEVRSYTRVLSCQCVFLLAVHGLLDCSAKRCTNFTTSTKGDLHASCYQSSTFWTTHVSQEGHMIISILQNRQIVRSSHADSFQLHGACESPVNRPQYLSWKQGKALCRYAPGRCVFIHPHNARLEGISRRSDSCLYI